MARRMARLVVLCVVAVSVAAASARAFWVTCTSSEESMSTIAYNTTYTVTTEAGITGGDPYYQSIQYSQVKLYSIIYYESTSTWGDWTLKGTTGTGVTNWNVANQEHDIYVS